MAFYVNNKKKKNIDLFKHVLIHCPKNVIQIKVIIIFKVEHGPNNNYLWYLTTQKKLDQNYYLILTINILLIYKIFIYFLFYFNYRC